MIAASSAGSAASTSDDPVETFGDVAAAAFGKRAPRIGRRRGAQRFAQQQVRARATARRRSSRATSSRADTRCARATASCRIADGRDRVRSSSPRPVRGRGRAARPRRSADRAIDAEQFAGRRNAAGRTGRDHQSCGRIGLQGACASASQRRVAARGGIDRASRLSAMRAIARAAVRGSPRPPPNARQAPSARGLRASRDRAPCVSHFVHQTARGCRPERLPARSRACRRAASRPSACTSVASSKLPPHRRDGGRQIEIAGIGIEQKFVLVDIAERPEIRAAAPRRPARVRRCRRSCAPRAASADRSSRSRARADRAPRRAARSIRARRFRRRAGSPGW